MLCACVFQWAILCSGFWENVRALVSTASTGSFPSIPLDLKSLVNGDYVVATILISFGALLGRLSPTQALWMAFVETIFATGNNSLMIYLGVSDPGGSMVIHCFGAAFGLAFAAAFGDAASHKPRTGNGEDALGTTRHNGTFAMIGTAFLFCFWPSFNAALLENPSAGRAVVNTMLSISGSVAIAFALSKAIHGGKFFDMEHIQNATLAGGVAIGAACDMILNPGAALATGVVAGTISTYGFSFLTPALKRRGLTDTCGIADLHLIPGIIGGVASAIAASGVGGAPWTAELISNAFPLRGSRSALVQGGFQMAVTTISLAMGALSGALAGAVLRRMGACVEPQDSFYEDGATWNVPLDDEELPEFEKAVSRAMDAERGIILSQVLKIVGTAVGKDLASGASVAAIHEVDAVPASPSGRSANQRFLEGSVHGADANKEHSLHGRASRKEV